MEKNKLKLAICFTLAGTVNQTVHDLDRLRSFISAVISSVEHAPYINNVMVLIAMDSAREDVTHYLQLEKEYPTLTIVLADLSKVSRAYLYLASFEAALAHGADLILEIDPTGSHNPQEIPAFIQPLAAVLADDKNLMGCVMSTRFSHGGKNSYPYFNVLVSKVGTVLARGFLGIGDAGKDLTDLTSGFEAFSATLLKKLLEIIPAKNWVSSYWGPLHLFQTEMRVMVFWLAAKYKITIFQRGISFGVNRTKDPKMPSFSYLFHAFIGFWLLMREYFHFKTKLRTN